VHGQPLDQVQPRRSLNNLAHLSLLQCKRRLFELLLHITAAEEAPVECQHSTVTPGCRGTHKSPPFRALLQSDSVVASSESDLGSAPLSVAVPSYAWI
jgi:hypothetical protein